MIHTCPRCQGSGRQTIVVSTVNTGHDTREEHEIDCIYCDLSGQMSEERHRSYLAEQEFHRTAWCKCASSPGSDYHADGEARRFTSTTGAARPAARSRRSADCL